MSTGITTLRDLSGLGHTPSRISESALIMVDCQNTYREGIMQLTGVEEAIKEAQKLLKLARELNVPVIHIQHDAGEGTPYDIRTNIGAISDEVAPEDDEVVIIKNYPNAFYKTQLDEVLKSQGINKIILAGFMTHMCINSTAHGGFNLGYSPTVVASTTATRALQSPDGTIIPAQLVHNAALASTRDLYAAVVEQVTDLLN